MAGPETRVRRAIRQRLNDLFPVGRFVAYVGGPFGARGVGDFLGCWNGQFISIEVKAPGEEPTKLQLYNLEQWMSAGGAGCTVHSVAELETWWLKRFGEEMPCPKKKKSSPSKSPSPQKPSVSCEPRPTLFSR